MTPVTGTYEASASVRSTQRLCNNDYLIWKLFYFDLDNRQWCKGLLTGSKVLKSRVQQPICSSFYWNMLMALRIHSYCITKICDAYKAPFGTKYNPSLRNEAIKVKKTNPLHRELQNMHVMKSWLHCKWMMQEKRNSWISPLLKYYKKVPDLQYTSCPLCCLGMKWWAF